MFEDLEDLKKVNKKFGITEKDIDSLIKKLENNGYIFEYEGNDYVGFWSKEDENKDRKYLKFKNWQEVQKFANNI